MSVYDFPSQSEMTREARNSLSGNWGLAIGGYVLMIVVSASAGLIPLIGPLLIAGPLGLGFARFSLNLSRYQDARIEDIFSGFNRFGEALIAHLLMTVAIIFGTLLFIIPGIILFLGLSQTLYILSDDPEISGVDALRKSWEVMDGYKGELFLFWLRFFGWAILCLFTLFIGFLWLGPYMQISFAKFYDEVMDIKHPGDHQDSDLGRHLIP